MDKVSTRRGSGRCHAQLQLAVVAVVTLLGTDVWAWSVEQATECRLLQRDVQVGMALAEPDERPRRAVRAAIRAHAASVGTVSHSCRWCVVRQFTRDVPIGSQRPCGDHDPCVTGDPLPNDFGACVSAVCRVEPECCSSRWIESCVALVSEVCGDDCEPCAHDECSPGSPLSTACSPCVETVCADDPYCCDTIWDEGCVARAEAACGSSCGLVPTTTSSTLAPTTTVTLAPTTTTVASASTTTTTFGTTTTTTPPQCRENSECDDGNACTDDYCLYGKCAYGYNRAPCSDGKGCTVGDTCLNGSCIGGPPRDCNDGNACTIDFCHSTSGECRHQARTCVDSNPCTNAVCDPQQGCLFPPIDCDDGNACTEDACSGGACTHQPATCDDSDPGTTDTCDPQSGCMSTP